MIAIDDLSDAIDATREFLIPVSVGKWLRLAVIALFVTTFGIGGPAFSGGNAGAGTTTDAPAGQPGPPVMIEDPISMSDLLIWGFVALGVVLALWIAYEFIAAIMTFVFLESLRTSEVHIRQYGGEHFRRGLWLFLFRLGVNLSIAVLLGVPLLLIDFFATGGLGALTIGSILIFLPYAIVVGLLYGILMQFTSAFVAPVMLIEDLGVLDAWRRFWTTLRANWTEYGLYLVVLFILQLVVGTAAWVVIGIAGLIMAIPFALVIGLLVFLLGPIGAVLSIPVALLGAVLGLLLTGVVWAPIASFFQYYALLLLGDTDPDLDLIPDQRVAIRAQSASWRRRPDEGDQTESNSTDESDGSINGGDVTDGDSRDRVDDDEDDGWR